MVVDGSKEAPIVLFKKNLRVFVAYLQFYFRVKGSFELAFEERSSKIIVNKFVNFSLNLKLDSRNILSYNRK